MIQSVDGLHIEPTNICTLKCLGCARTRFLEKWPQHWRNHNLDTDALMRFLDVDLQDKRVLFNGNYGDPIYHPDFIGMVKAFKQRGSWVRIITNGSYKKSEWWEELCTLLDSRDQITFSIDGTPDNFTLYRENADWSSIEEGIRVCVESPAATEWKLIPFRFNQDHIDRARDTSQSLGIDHFTVTPSDRFDERTQHLIPSKDLIAFRKDSQDKFKQGAVITVDPKCSTQREHFITATGHWSPCCYMTDHRFYYKTVFGKDLGDFDITRTTISRILQAPKVVTFFSELPKNPITACQFNCPSV